MLRNSASLESFCPTCKEFKFKYNKFKDLYRTQKLHISELEDAIRQQKLDVAHAKQIADGEKANADLLRGKVHFKLNHSIINRKISITRHDSSFECGSSSSEH